jgi:hypothetical protein
MYGNTSGTMYFEAWDGGSWNIIDSWSGNSTTSFTSRGPYNFSATGLNYTNSDFKIRFRIVTGGTSYQNDFAVDEVYLYGDLTGGSYTQESFRGKEDAGGESDTTWIAALNTNFTWPQDTNLRMRFLVQETADVAEADVSFQLQYNHNGGGWNNVTGSSSVARSSAGGLTEGGNTTQQIGSGTFVTPNGGQDESDGIAGGSSLDFTTTVNQEVELEFCFQIRSADTSGGDTIQFRLIKDGSPLDAYTNTPTVTLPSPPSITSVGGDDEFNDEEEDVVIVGSNFYATQGSGKVELCPSSTYGSAVEQTVALWGASQIDFDVVMGGLSLGTNYLFVTNDDDLRNATGFPVNIVAAPISEGLFKTTGIQGTITAAGLTVSAFLISDE